jgi:hypothetical protein
MGQIDEIQDQESFCKGHVNSGTQFDWKQG